jgi:hypothetical protein
MTLGTPMDMKMDAKVTLENFDLPFLLSHPINALGSNATIFGGFSKSSSV